MEKCPGTPMFYTTGAKSQEGQFVVKSTGGGGGAGSIVWGLGFWLGK